MQLVQAGLRDSCLQVFVSASYKTDGAANEDDVEIKLARPYSVDFVLLHTASMNETNRGNKSVVTVTPLIFKSCRQTYTYVICKWRSCSQNKRCGQLYYMEYEGGSFLRNVSAV